MSDDERVISWFEENYKGLLLGIVVGLSILFSYKYFLANQNKEQLELSRQFDVAVENYRKGNTDIMLSFSESNMSNNADNIYTSLANLYSAKIMYLDNKIEESHIFLDHIINYSDDTEIIDIAKYRKAKILLEEMNFSEAHSVLGDEPDNYQHIELKGDIYYLEKNIDEAVNYYNKALLYSLTPNERKNIKAKINSIK